MDTLYVTIREYLRASTKEQDSFGTKPELMVIAQAKGENSNHAI
jgi:hypothetical protein